VLVFPRGNNTDHLSMYLDVADSHLLPPGWSRYAQFSLAVVNQLDSKMSIRKGISFFLKVKKRYFLLSLTGSSCLYILKMHSTFFSASSNITILPFGFLHECKCTFIKYAIQHKLDSDYL